jgi:hypothetical protein
MGGMVIPHVARLRPVSRLVFLCAMVQDLPNEDLAVDAPDVPMTSIDMNMVAFDGKVSRISPEGATEFFFGHCDPAEVEWALPRLRPQGPAIREPLPAPWPDVPSSVILTTDDRAHNPDFDRFITGPRLGVVPIELPGDHSPFLSGPRELARVLNEVTDG